MPALRKHLPVTHVMAYCIHELPPHYTNEKNRNHDPRTCLHIKRHPPADVLPNVPINTPKRTPAACYIRATRTDRRVPHSLRRGDRLLGAPFKMESLRDAVASNPSRGSVIGCRAALRNRLLEINSWVTKRARPRYCAAAYHWINGTSTINRLLRIAMEPVSSF